MSTHRLHTENDQVYFCTAMDCGQPLTKTLKTRGIALSGLKRLLLVSLICSLAMEATAQETHTVLTLLRVSRRGL